MSINRNKTLDTAQKLVQKGQIDKAIKEFQKLLENDPKKDVRTLLRLGDLYSKKGDINEAKEVYKKVARYYSDEGFYLKAIAVYKQILKSDSANATDIYLKLGELYQQLGLTSDSIANYNIVAEEYEKKGSRSESIDLYKKISELNPDKMASKLKLIDLYIDEGLGDQAREELKSAAISLKEKERDDDLLKILEKLLSIDSDNLGVITEISELYLKLNEPKKALSALQNAYKKDYENTEILRLLARSFIALEQPDKVKSVYGEMKKIFEDRNLIQEAREIGRKIMEIDGKYSEEEVEEVPQDEISVELNEDFKVEETPGEEVEVVSTASNISRLVTEADVYAKYDLNDKAIERLKDVLLEDGENIEAHTKIKDLYIKMNKLLDAKNELFILVNIHERENNKNEAIKLLKELSTLDPENISIVKRMEQFNSEWNEISDKGEKGDQMVEVQSEGEKVKTDELFDISFDDTLIKADKKDYLTEIGEVSDKEIKGEKISGELSFESIDTIEKSDSFLKELSFELGTSEEKIEVKDEPLVFDEVESLQKVDIQATSIEQELAAKENKQNTLIELEIPDIDIDLGEINETVNQHEALADSGSPQIIDAKNEYIGDSELNMEVTEPREIEKHDETISDSKINNFIIDLEIGAGESPLQKEIPTEEIKTDESYIDKVGFKKPPQDEEIHEISSDLLEAEFFFDQGLYEEAKNILNPLSIIYPHEKRVKSLLERVENIRIGTKTNAIPEIKVESIYPEKGFFDLASEIKSDFDDFEIESKTKAVDIRVEDTGEKEDFSKTLTMFKKGIRENIETSDYETHFNLGIAFKGMALYQEAIDEFARASKFGNKEFECSLEIGECHFKRGDTKRALSIYNNILENKSISASEKFEIFNAIGSLYEYDGDFALALKHYNSALVLFPDSKELSSKIEKINSMSNSENIKRDPTPISRKKQEKNRIGYV